MELEGLLACHKCPPPVRILTQISPFYLFPKDLSRSNALIPFRTTFSFYDELLVSRPTSYAKDQSLSAVCHCLLNIFAPTLSTRTPSPLSAT